MHSSNFLVTIPFPWVLDEQGQLVYNGIADLSNTSDDDTTCVDVSLADGPVAQESEIASVSRSFIITSDTYYQTLKEKAAKKASAALRKTSAALRKTKKQAKKN